MMNAEKIKKLYKEGFKQVVNPNRLDKMINEAKGTEKQRLQEFKWFVECANIDVADITGLIMLNKSYQFWQSIFLYILKELSKTDEDDKNEQGYEDTEAEERSVNRTLTDDEIEILTPNERSHIEDYDEDEEDYEEDYEEDNEE